MINLNFWSFKTELIAIQSVVEFNASKNKLCGNVAGIILRRPKFESLSCHVHGAQLKKGSGLGP